MAASGIYTLLALIVLTIIVILLLTTSKKNSSYLIDTEYERTIDILSQFVNPASLK